MITAYDPNGLLKILNKDHIIATSPVSKLNFLSRFDPNMLSFDSPWIAWDGEVIDHKNEFWQAKRLPMALFCTHLSTNPDPHPIPRVFYPHHLLLTIQTNIRLGRIPTINNRYEDKPFLADALLGQPRSSRWIFLSQLRERGLLDKCLVNFMDGFFETMDRLDGLVRGWPSLGKPSPYRSPALAQYDDEPVLEYLSKSGNVFNSTLALPSYGSWISQVIPTKIYKASHITVVTETDTSEEHFFITEKIAKPLLSGRIFIAIGSKGILKKLKSMGFATFDDIIDESYDDYWMEHERVIHAAKTLDQVSKENMKSLYEKAMPIIKHNQSVMLSGLLGSEARSFIDGLAA